MIFIMPKRNIFDGESYYAMFVRIVYKRFVSREWFTYADAMAEHMGLNSADELPSTISKCDNYGDLKKAFRDVMNEISRKCDGECFEEKGNNRNKMFHYIGKDDDPLADIRNAKVIYDLQKYWRFCQDSAGFFPTSWLEYFFKDCKDLLDIKEKREKGEQVLTSTLDRILTNIELLPFLYEAIINKMVLTIEYKPYEEETMELTFHPQYLREYNGRWHLFGHAENMPFLEWTFDIAIDRIVGRPRELYKFAYKTAPVGFYKDFFRNKVGVSNNNEEEPKTVRIRAYGQNIYKLTETKPIHQSQKNILPYGDHEDGTYGEFELYVEVNNEFIGRILQMGAGLEVVAPKDVRKIFADRINEMHCLYNNIQHT